MERVSATPRTGDVLFPLASNARSLVTGSGVDKVRARLKLSSLLYRRVLLEAGDMSIQAGPQGSQTWRHPPGPDSTAKWQTPVGRGRAQAVPFSLSIAPERQPGVLAPGPYHQVLHSQTSICWLPTFEPFRRELPSGCDWVVFGSAGEIAPVFQHLADRWKRVDAGNTALDHLVPEQFVRSCLVDHVTEDMATGLAGGWDVSVDQLHGEVLSARFAKDATVQAHGVALPILVPRVGDLAWDDVARIRRLPGIERLRETLHEVEVEAAEVTVSGGDLEATIRRAYDRKLRATVEQVEGVGGLVGHTVAELLVGTAAGYATIGLALAAPPAGAAIGAVVIGAWKIYQIRRGRRRRAWVGVMDAISDAASV